MQRDPGRDVRVLVVKHEPIVIEQTHHVAHVIGREGPALAGIQHGRSGGEGHFRALQVETGGGEIR